MQPSHNEIFVDGFTWTELKDMLFDGIAIARCAICGEEHDVELDAVNLSCNECGALSAVTSPLVKAGLV